MNSRAGEKRPRRAAAVFGLTALGLAFPLAAHAQAPIGSSKKTERGDTVFVSLQGIDATAGGGGGASLEWLHAFSPEKTLNLGLSSFSVGGTRWSYGRAGATWRPFSRTSLHAEADLGSGRESGANFAYRVVRGSVAGEVIEKRLVLEIEDQYIDVRPATGNTIRVAAAVFAGGSLTTRVGVLTSTSGNLGTRALTARIDLERDRWTVFGGLSAGRSQPSVLALIPNAGGQVETSREFFCGTAVRVGRQQVTVAFDLLELSRSRRGSLVLGWRVPL